MGVIKTKRCKKIMNYFRMSLGLFAPYITFIDVDFLKEGALFTANFQREFEKVVGDSVHLFITSCIKKQIDAENGPEWQNPNLNKVYFTLKEYTCGHKTNLTPAECLHDVIVRGNNRFILASQCRGFDSEGNCPVNWRDVICPWIRCKLNQFKFVPQNNNNLKAQLHHYQNAKLKANLSGKNNVKFVRTGTGKQKITALMQPLLKQEKKILKTLTRKQAKEAKKEKKKLLQAQKTKAIKIKTLFKKKKQHKKSAQ
eukprot:TRINITY_DN2650_c4_g1_i1.p1 TRINITY_DN2650_c4_g1~~TRINITY_DN2650_c4_g1_i1.p1  ORF type:complete len:255 (+),score=82.04 TRINITY_DN2650_c4_g1_i1:115-879(+)